MSGSKPPARLWLLLLVFGASAFVAGAEDVAAVHWHTSVIWSVAAVIWAFAIRTTVHTAILEARADEYRLIRGEK